MKRRREARVPQGIMGPGVAARRSRFLRRPPSLTGRGLLPAPGRPGRGHPGSHRTSPTLFPSSRVWKEKVEEEIK